jgi:hypothetical protein
MIVCGITIGGGAPTYGHESAITRSGKMGSPVKAAPADAPLPNHLRGHLRSQWMRNNDHEHEEAHEHPLPYALLVGHVQECFFNPL